MRRIEGTKTKGGLEVRATASRDLEKLRQREQGGGQAGMGLDGNGAGIGGASEGTNLTLFEQLQQNKEDKEEDYEAQLRESRMPKALDDDEIAFLNEQEMRNVREQEARMQQEQRDLDEFRAARATASSSIPSISFAKRNSGETSRNSAPSGFFGDSQEEQNHATHRSRMPKIALKRRRREESSCGDDSGKAVGDATKRARLPDNSSSATSSAVLSLAAYASSSDSDSGSDGKT